MIRNIICIKSINIFQVSLTEIIKIINIFHATGLFLYLLKKIRKPLVFWCFREYRKRPVVRNLLKIIFLKSSCLPVFYMAHFFKGCELGMEIKMHSTTNVILGMASVPDQIFPRAIITAMSY